MLTVLLDTRAPLSAPFDALDDAGLEALRARYEPPVADWLRINLIVSVSGSAAGPDGTSESLTNRTDRRILGVIRRQADLVLVGAASVRAEGYRIPATTTLGIVTGTGDLTGHRIDASETARLVVFCPASAADRVLDTLPGCTVVQVADHEGRIDARTLLAAIAATGARSIVCEGGPSLAAQLAAIGAVDEVCLTTSPMLTGTTLPSLGATAFAPIALRPALLMTDEHGALYSRWLTWTG
jgi:riboflavin biosynthesis pyrimidine reductase